MKLLNMLLTKINARKQVLVTLLMVSLLIFGCTTNDQSIKKSQPSPTKLEKQFSKAIKRVQSQPENERLQLLNDFSNKAQKQANNRVLFLANYGKGNLYYSILNNDSALVYWQKALTYAERTNDYENTANLNSNLGTIYLQNGYLKTAINYFLTAQKIKQKLKEIDENYWSIYLNIGVANMSLHQYDRASTYFNTIPTRHYKSLKFLVYLNKAKLQALKNNQYLFYYNLDLAKQYLVKNSFYTNIFDQVFLELSLDFKNLKRLNFIQTKLAPTYFEQPLYIKILLQHAALIINGKTINKEDVTSVFAKDVLSTRDVYTEMAYNDMLAFYFKLKKDYKNYANFLEKRTTILDKINDSEAKIALNDFQIALSKNKLSYENEQLKTSIQLKTLKIKNHRYLTAFLILSMLGLIILVWYILKFNKKNQLAKEQDVTSMQLSLEQQIIERQRLQKLVQNQEFKIKEILTNVSKIAILKKQMEEFILSMNEISQASSEKNLLKQAKINTDAFFNNYIDLAILASQKDENDLKQIKAKYSAALSENEMNVLLLILNDYTSKEIAILLTKSEKGIEYSRKNIRLKLAIPKEIAIKQFIFDALN
jgi:DNA-binding CsgD family transcriptional regulator